MSKMGEMVMDVEEMFSADVEDTIIAMKTGLSKQMIAEFRIVYEESTRNAAGVYDSESRWDSFDADRPDR